MSIFWIQGSLDITNVTKRLDQAKKVLVRECGLALDLTRVTWIDSAGLAGLVQLLADAKALGAELRLTGASAAVIRALDCARLDKLFPLRGQLD